MSISEHERQVLASIEDDLTGTSPKLRSMLAMFGRLAEGEEMPARDGTWRPSGALSARGHRTRPRSPIRSVTRPGVGSARTGRGLRRFRWPVAWLVWLLIALAIMVWALTFAHGVGGAACPLARAAACARVLAPKSPDGERHARPAHIPGRLGTIG